MLTSKDKPEDDNVSNESDSKMSVDAVSKTSNTESHTCKLKSIMSESIQGKHKLFILLLMKLFI